jgi:hypothetical protein
LEDLYFSITEAKNENDDSRTKDIEKSRLLETDKSNE